MGKYDIEFIVIHSFLAGMLFMLFLLQVFNKI